ncbi:PA0069 family radical SAM protein [Shimia biformata]|uniref:PA0069 family radical SAM protein n=1 Tax=Shimia biformata TaxID=1294299 RepID=UPI00194E905F|nr:PA0069 family radical SAM protein [Shimia biformata]
MTATTRPDIDPDRRRGRGALTNQSGRFDLVRVEENDGWDMAEERGAFQTHVTEERIGRLITYNTSPDLPFDRSINPYRGCEHGCVYCFARPTHAYLGLSPGLDFETRLVARPNAAEVLERELRARSYTVAPVAIGTNTDPYQPVERDRGIMRDVLGVLREFRHPVGIVTKGALVERDIDILAPMAAQGLTHVGVSLTTLDADLSRRMEPRAPSPARRLRMIRSLSDAGIPVRAMLAPVVPGLTDHEVEPLLSAARDAGASAASWIMLRLPREVEGLMMDWLTAHYPNKAEKVMARLREMHGGKAYTPEWGRRMRGEGIHAEMIAQRFRKAAARLGLDKGLPPLRTDLFLPPLARDGQLALF